VLCCRLGKAPIGLVLGSAGTGLALCLAATGCAVPAARWRQVAATAVGSRLPQRLPPRPAAAARPPLHLASSNHEWHLAKRVCGRAIRALLQQQAQHELVARLCCDMQRRALPRAELGVQQCRVQP
jgi:hypothetical protein